MMLLAEVPTLNIGVLNMLTTLGFVVFPAASVVCGIRRLQLNGSRRPFQGCPDIDWPGEEFESVPIRKSKEGQTPIRHSEAPICD